MKNLRILHQFAGQNNRNLALFSGYLLLKNEMGAIRSEWFPFVFLYFANPSHTPLKLSFD